MGRVLSLLLISLMFILIGDLSSFSMGRILIKCRWVNLLRDGCWWMLEGDIKWMWVGLLVARGGCYSGGWWGMMSRCFVVMEMWCGSSGQLVVRRRVVSWYLC